MIEQEEDYSWSQELRDRENRQDYCERLGSNNQEVSDEWEDGIPPEIQELIDWYKEDNVHVGYIANREL